MKRTTSALLFLVLSSLSNAGTVRPAWAVDKLGFSKRQDGWIGGAALHATGCPSDTQDCGNDQAQSWCCPKGTVCKYDYCCPNNDYCDKIVRTFPSCADPTWTLCTYVNSGASYYCCQPGEICYMALGQAPACGPPSLPVQPSQKLSTVSPSYTRSATGVYVPAASSVSPQPTPSTSYTIPTPLSSSSSSSSSSSVSHSSSALVSDQTSQVSPSITRNTGSTPTPGSSQTPVGAAGANGQSTSSTGSPGSSSGSISSGLSGGAIAGIVIGAIIGLALIALVGIFGARYGSKKALEGLHGSHPDYSTPPMYNSPPDQIPVFKPDAVEVSETGYRPPADERTQEMPTDGYRT